MDIRSGTKPKRATADEVKAYMFLHKMGVREAKRSLNDWYVKETLNWLYHDAETSRTVDELRSTVGDLIMLLIEERK